VKGQRSLESLYTMKTKKKLEGYDENPEHHSWMVGFVNGNLEQTSRKLESRIFS
jgi:hypothetical protein